MYKESNFRSLFKAISWRISGTVATVITVFLFTRELKLAAAVGGVEFIIKIGLFYLHERIWDKVPLGKRVKQPLEQKTIIANIPGALHR